MSDQGAGRGPEGGRSGAGGEACFCRSHTLFMSSLRVVSDDRVARDTESLGVTLWSHSTESLYDGVTLYGVTLRSVTADERRESWRQLSELALESQQIQKKKV